MVKKRGARKATKKKTRGASKSRGRRTLAKKPPTVPLLIFRSVGDFCEPGSVDIGDGYVVLYAEGTQDMEIRFADVIGTPFKGGDNPIVLKAGQVRLERVKLKGDPHNPVQFPYKLFHDGKECEFPTKTDPSMFVP